MQVTCDRENSTLEPLGGPTGGGLAALGGASAGASAAGGAASTGLSAGSSAARTTSLEVLLFLEEKHNMLVLRVVVFDVTF